MKRIILFVICSIPFLLKAQILFTESYTVILDTTKQIKGNFLPSFKYQNQRENLLEFSNQADLSALIGDNAITFANNVAVTRFGGETILSGGYIYGEYRHLYEKTLTLETYGQVHWAEARGMERKYAAGVNARFRIHKSKGWGLFAGIGPFYEYEKWNFDGISDDSLIPPNETFRTQENLKLGSYISLKYTLQDFLIDVSVYHQARFDEIFTFPRFASSARITYNFTKVLGLALTYQNIYDPKPLVPISKLFQKLELGFSVSF